VDKGQGRRDGLPPATSSSAPTTTTTTTITISTKPTSLTISSATYPKKPRNAPHSNLDRDHSYRRSCHLASDHASTVVPLAFAAHNPSTDANTDHHDANSCAAAFSGIYGRQPPSRIGRSAAASRGSNRSSHAPRVLSFLQRHSILETTLSSGRYSQRSRHTDPFCGPCRGDLPTRSPNGRSPSHNQRALHG
jgi:hypothetical protein